jgi:hypothetical protein
MLDGSDTQTVHALRLLPDAISQSEKPLVFWVGAGASAWCGYPLWAGLADTMHSKYLKYEPEYNETSAHQAIQFKNYPDLFQQCKGVNKQRYFSMLAESLRPREITPVYQRFIDAVSAINPINVLTTNADELLETNLSGVSLIQRSDLERCIDLLTSKRSFVCKLHGSVSSIQTAVFTTEDYRRLVQDSKFLELLRYIFASATVVFLGYGLADKYVLDQISRAKDLKSIFGDGPHFAIAPLEVLLPTNLQPIRYIPDPDKDHRSAIQVIEEIKTYKGATTCASPTQYEVLKAGSIRSAHLLSRLYPPGIHKTKGSATLTGGVGMIYGHGLTDAEIPSTISTAMHDLIVGLLCFDTVYAFFTYVGALHTLIGTRSLTELMLRDALKFVLMPTQDVILYKNASEPNGMLNSIYFSSRTQDHPELTAEELFNEQIRRILKPRAGGDVQAIEAHYELIKSCSFSYSRQTEPNIKGLVEGLLLRGSIRSLIGMSGGTSLNSLPSWMIYPVLRLAYVVRTGVTCQLLGLASAKLEYGESKLAGPAFAASTGQEWADGMASYVMTGRFDSGFYMYDLRDWSVLNAILEFRESSQGIALRTEILEKLSLRLGGDVVTSVNAALKAAIPSTVLQQAHDQMTGLLITDGIVPKMTPALWNNPDYADKALSLWKTESGNTLREYCLKERIGMSDYCPCGSGEKLKLCCAESLNIRLA